MVHVDEEAAPSSCCQYKLFSSGKCSDTPTFKPSTKVVNLFSGGRFTIEYSFFLHLLGCDLEFNASDCLKECTFDNSKKSFVGFMSIKTLLLLLRRLINSLYSSGKIKP